MRKGNIVLNLLTKIEENIVNEIIPMYMGLIKVKNSISGFWK